MSMKCADVCHLAVPEMNFFGGIVKQHFVKFYDFSICVWCHLLSRN